MTEQTHRQFVLEQAKRFKAAGWTVIYAVNSYRRSVEVVQGLIDDALAAGVEPVVFQEDPLMEGHNKARFLAAAASEDFCFPGQGIDELYDDAGYVVAAGPGALAGKVETALGQLSDHGAIEARLLAIEERERVACKGGLAHAGHIAHLVVPPPVQALEPKPCPYCRADLYVKRRQNGQLMYDCHRYGQHRKNGRSDRYEVSATVTIVDRSTERETYTRQVIYKPWSQGESEKAKQLRSQGLSYPAIGKVLGRTVRSVGSHLWTGGYEGTLQRQSTRAYLRERIAAIDAANAVGRNP